MSFHADPVQSSHCLIQAFVPHNIWSLPVLFGPESMLTSELGYEPVNVLRSNDIQQLHYQPF